MPHKEKSTIELLSNTLLSILAQGLLISGYGAQLGAFFGVFVGITWAIFFRAKGDDGLLASVAIGVIIFGLIGFIIAGLIGIIQGILRAYHSNQLYSLYVHVMVWLGAAPPPTYDYLLSNTFRGLGVKRAIIRTGFWLGFWALEGLILGAVGGAISGAFVFEGRTGGESLFMIAVEATVWAMLGAFLSMTLVPYLWFTYKIMQKLKPVQFYTARSLELQIEWLERLFWLAGGKIGEKLFRRMFGDDF